MNFEYKCCDRQSIQTMDYKWPSFSENQVVKINRVCLRCWTHWFGIDGDVKKFSSKEWDSWINQSLNDTPSATPPVAE